MVLDVSGLDDDDPNSDENQKSVKPPQKQIISDRSLAARFIQMVGAEPDQAPRPLRRLHISQLLQMILQDAQTRLFFKAQAVIQSDIRYYAPLAGDLDYPAKLKGMSPIMSHFIICLKGTKRKQGGL